MADKTIDIKNLDEKENVDSNIDSNGSEESKDNKPQIENNLETELNTVKNEAKQNHDKYLRLLAEFDNYKKRSGREIEEFRKFSNESLIKELLIAVDNMERALSASSQTLKENTCLIEGVDMTIKEILKVFKKFGVSRVETQGKTFDPNFHQALISRESDEYPENTIIQELQKGYIMHGRLLRPAMVAVSTLKAKACDKDSEDNKNE